MLWKTVTKDGRRLYRYTSNETVARNLKTKQGYIRDSYKTYGPSPSKYCELRKTKKYGTVCRIKTYKLPNFAKFEEYVRKAEEARLRAEANSSSVVSGVGQPYIPITDGGGSDTGERPRPSNSSSGTRCELRYLFEDGILKAYKVCKPN